MEKKKIAARDVRARNSQIYQVAYCGLQTLFQFEDASGYSASVNGWDWDVYEFNGVAFVTGYRNTFGEEIPYDTCQGYERIAKQYDSKEGRRSVIDMMINDLRARKEV